MNDSVVTLPANPVKARRAPFPWLAAMVPMIGGLVLWGVTGSLFSLLFALLGPVIAVASLLDSARNARRIYRAASVSYETLLVRAEQQIAAHHERERAMLMSRHPDALQLAASPARFWRRGREDAAELVIARGERASVCRVAAGADEESDEGAAATLAQLRARAGVLQDAPISIPVAGGVMIRGEEPFASAAARAMVMQLCMTWAPGTLRDLVLPEQGWEWARELPHIGPELAVRSGVGAGVGRPVMNDARAAARAGALKVKEASGGMEVSMRLAGGDLLDRDSAASHAHDFSQAVVTDRAIRIVYGPPGTPVDPRCVALIDISGADGSSQLVIGEQTMGVSVQLWGEAQSRMVARALCERAVAMIPVAREEEVVPPLAELLAQYEGAPGGGGTGEGIGDGRASTPEFLVPGRLLPVPVAVGNREAVIVDIVGDGPHALVAGMTGSGKSELLVSWVTALCALYSPDQVVFLLADFKGGTAFAPLVALPHVVGMITDLDASAARRALESLRAEVRWREARLAEVGARDIADGSAAMPRLVVVVDEFAALLAQHPELQELFADITARGRALGIHLVLGTQRAAGTVRDGLLANIPLRVCLRVVDEADSRTVVGAAGAAALPATRPGAVLIRRASDNAPVVAQVVRSRESDRDAARRCWVGFPTPRRPWLPPLPSRIEAVTLVHWAEVDVDELQTAHAEDLSAMPALVLGVLDEPAAQRQTPWAFSPERERSLLVVGGAGSGKTTTLRMVEHAVRGAGVVAGAGVGVDADDAGVARRRECVWISADREDAWDTMERLTGWYRAEGATTVVLIDDLDALVAGLPGDYAERFVGRLETLLREGARNGISVVATVQRLPIAGTRLGDVFNARLVLQVPRRTDHLAAGADGATFLTDRPAGRGVINGTEVQIALPPTNLDGSSVWAVGVMNQAETEWMPPPGLVGVVSRTPAVCEAQLRSGWAVHGTVVVSLRTLHAGTRAAELAALGADPSFGAGADLDGGASTNARSTDSASRAVVIVGDADAWQQHWSLLAAIRAGHPLIIDGGSPSEFRAMTGSRELPPYIAGDAAWLCSPDASVIRVRLPRPPQGLGSPTAPTRRWG